MDEILTLLIEIRELLKELVELKRKQLMNDVNVIDTTDMNGSEGQRGLLE